MREELRMGNRKIISLKLKELIADTLAKKEQIIIMLNRRGFSTFVMCRACGHVNQMQILRFTTCLSSSWYLTMPSLRYHRNRSYYLPKM